MNNKHLLYAAVMAMTVAAATPALADGNKGDKGKHKGAIFQKVDVNKDGIITKAEFMDHAETRFTKMDTDGNGSFTKEEAKAKHKAMKDKRGDKIKVNN